MNQSSNGILRARPVSVDLELIGENSIPISQSGFGW